MQVLRYVGRFRSRRKIRVPDELYDILGMPRYLKMSMVGNSLVFHTDPSRSGVPVRMYRVTEYKRGKEYMYTYVSIPKNVMEICRWAQYYIVEYRYGDNFFTISLIS